MKAEHDLVSFLKDSKDWEVKEFPDIKHKIQGDKIITTFSYNLPVVQKYVFVTFKFKIDKITVALGNAHYAKNGKLYRRDI